MFDRESGDMLPRPAPKPRTPPNEHMFKPTVPEVSILFDQKNEKQQHTDNSKHKDNKSPTKKVQTYAAWKKQMLPHVAFPRESEREVFQHTNENPINELYQMRTHAPMGQMPIAPQFNYEVPFYVNTVSSRPTTAPAYITQPLYQQQRRSLDTIGHQFKANEVLTLCASTQTDVEVTPQTLPQFATKTDVDNLLEIVQQIRNDQLRLMHILQINTQTNLHHKQTNEAGTQSEQKTVVLAAATQTENVTQNVTVPQARFHTPRLPPAAQSTAYQGHTPSGILRRSSTVQTAKPTDKTLAMNELAMKYLPDEKLHELMGDMQLGAPRNPVMERVMIASKGPTDMSNASYKYLKKYRLLPEEENNNTPKTMRFYDEDTRHSQPNSPYEPRPVDSPMILRRAASEGVNVNEDRSDLINLEDLRNKPKFM